MSALIDFQSDLPILELRAAWLGPDVRFSGARALARTCVSALIEFQSDLPILELGAAWGQMFDFQVRGRSLGHVCPH